MKTVSILIAILSPIGLCLADKLQQQFEKAYFLEIARGQTKKAMEMYLEIAKAADNNGEMIQQALDRLKVLYAAEHGSFDWQQAEPYILPNFIGYFSDDVDGGLELDALWNAPDRDTRSDKEILTTVQFGLRRTNESRSLILRWIGNKYLVGQFPQHPSAVEIMYHAADFSGSDTDPYGTTSHAVYYGLSVTQPKTPSILRALAEFCMRIDNPHDLNRVAWGSKSQQSELIEYLQPYLKSVKNATRMKAEDCKMIFEGTINALDWSHSKDQLKDIAPVQQLVDQAVPGTTVHIPPGCYLGTLKIDKNITLKGSSKETTILEAFSDGPLIQISPMSRVQLESLTFNPSRETDEPSGSCISAYRAEIKVIDCNFKTVESTKPYSTAISVDAGRMDLGNCNFDGFIRGVIYTNSAKGSVKNCNILNVSDYGIYVANKCAVDIEHCQLNGAKYAIAYLEHAQGAVVDCEIIDPKLGGVSIGEACKVDLHRCHIVGSDYAISYSDRARGSVVDCIIVTPLFCGIFVDDDCSVEIKRAIATGSHSHGIYCTGGNLVITDSLVVRNNALGIYIGNHSSYAELSNNAIIGNGTGISVASTKLKMSNNIILCNAYGCIDTRVSDFLLVHNNIFAGNKTGLDVGRDWDNHIMLTRNTFWNNEVTSKNFYLASKTIEQYPAFESPVTGNYAVLNPVLKSENQGLVDPAILEILWQKWSQHIDEEARSAIIEKLDEKLFESSESEYTNL